MDQSGFEFQIVTEGEDSSTIPDALRPILEMAMKEGSFFMALSGLTYLELGRLAAHVHFLMCQLIASDTSRESVLQSQKFLILDHLESQLNQALLDYIPLDAASIVDPLIVTQTNECDREFRHHLGQLALAILGQAVELKSAQTYDA